MKKLLLLTISLTAVQLGAMEEEFEGQFADLTPTYVKPVSATENLIKYGQLEAYLNFIKPLQVVDDRADLLAITIDLQGFAPNETLVISKKVTLNLLYQALAKLFVITPTSFKLQYNGSLLPRTDAQTLADFCTTVDPDFETRTTEPTLVMSR